MPEPDFTDLDLVHAWCLDRLIQAARTRGDAMAWPVLATRSGETGVSARTLVLRDVDRLARELVLFTDARSPKAAEIAADRRACLVFLDPAAQIQLRAYGHARLVTEGERHRQWRAELSGNTRFNYATEAPPGTPAAGPDIAMAPHKASDAFALIILQFSHLDVLKLGATRHRRVLVDWRGAGHEPDLTWRVP